MMRFNLDALDSARIFLITLIGISLPYHSPPLTLIAICVVLVLGIKANFKTFFNFDKLWRTYLIFGIVYLLSCLISNLINDEGLTSKHLTKNFFFILLPLSLGANRDILKSLTIRKFFIFFCIATIVFVSVALIKTLYLFKIGVVNTIFYESIEQTARIHTTYLSLLIVLSFHYLLNQYLSLNARTNIKSRIILLGVIFLFTLNFIVLARVGIIAMVFIILFHLIFNAQNSKFKLFFTTLIIFGVIGAGFIKFGWSGERIKNLFEANQNNKSDTANRVILWTSALDAFQNSPNKLLGAGLDKSQVLLNNSYRANNFFGYKSNYNTHNQYLQTMLENGWMGICILLFAIIYGFIKAIKQKKYLFLGVLMIFCIFFLTESILERQLGILSFLIFLPLSYLYKNEN
ncbi:O-antigen ligase family protein [Mesonia sediminis]|uniref:O-antigen ligase family protein n=1 Tax=Mesonia sediminis TaxID=1703946 RepID=A0ABW5SEU2_9FLAO